MACHSLEDALNCIQMTFDKYSGTDSDKGTLSQKELCSLARKEFPSLCKDAKSEDILKGILGDMDMDGDQKVTFREYMLFLCFLQIALREIK